MDPAALAHFHLADDVIFLNHGSFGACPKVVLAEQARLRTQMEQRPVQFFMRDLEPMLDAARAELAKYVKAKPANLAFVPNATAAVNAVAQSLSSSFSPGDELLTTDHAYNACKNVLDRVAARAGAGVVVATLPVPMTKASTTRAILEAATPKTRLALLDHVTSPTAAVLPLEDIVPVLENRGVAVLVDGAHAPGMIDVDVDALGASFYTGNCHKWMCAPKGAGFLVVRDDWLKTVKPAITSHGANATRTDRSAFLLEFDWIGTHDFTPYLCVPAAIRFIRDVVDPARNRALALEAGKMLASAFSVEPVCAGDMCGSMRSIPLPSSPSSSKRSALELDTLQEALATKHHIEVPIMAYSDESRLVRVSAQVYNVADDYAALARALAEELRSASS